MAIVPLLIKLLLPVAIQEAGKKVAANHQKEIKAVNDATKGAIASKTMWFSLILAVLGLIEQYQSLLSSLIGADKMGLVLTAAGVVTAVLRAVTGQSLSDKGSDDNSFGG